MLFITIATLQSQIIGNSQKAQEEIFLAQTKQFSEFTDRFNYKTDFYGKPVDSLFKAKMPRERMISLLFDLKDPRSDSGNKNFNNEFLNTKNAFISEIGRKDLFINKHSTGIIAEARSRVIHKGKPQTISLFLNQEIVGNGSVKWVLLSASGEIFNIFKEDTAMVRFIPPASHETDFMNLKRALEDTDHLQDYAAGDFRPDILTIFFFCINSGIIKYEYVEEVVYHIIDIPGWYVKVKNFNRNELNSGWLITDVTKNTHGFYDFLRNL